MSDIPVEIPRKTDEEKAPTVGEKPEENAPTVGEKPENAPTTGEKPEENAPSVKPETAPSGGEKPETGPPVGEKPEENAPPGEKPRASTSGKAAKAEEKRERGPVVEPAFEQPPHQMDLILDELSLVDDSPDIVLEGKTEEQKAAELKQIEEEADKLFRLGWKYEFGYCKDLYTPEEIAKKRTEIFSTVLGLHRKANRYDDTYERMVAIRSIHYKLKADKIVEEVEAEYDDESLESCKKAYVRLSKAADIYYYCMQNDGVYSYNFSVTSGKCRNVRKRLEELLVRDGNSQIRLLSDVYKGTYIQDIKVRGNVV
ncbi:uncharacterized protein LOC100142445 isoform X2 [Tribolium castaneum]|uniref:uncharacterized protein LOC100142445 isoform X2 n=1 Tax=Tribolium castaneum TaxID=7070 RepID=UPI00046BEE53|nr:PREDICTED: uncharacterized protein LOC100142445 isoform X2 [Tribolium castaneum]|eukprot:XP_008194798.1 PREDICTED: uncharacterized protein LOC100142445 isoform X2 [Tribolium castaneum]